MSLTLSLDTKADPENVLAVVYCRDPDLVGHEATLTLSSRVEVHGSSPVHSEKKLFARTFVVGSEPERIKIPRRVLPPYTYRGQHVDVELAAKLKVDDGVLFDSTFKEEHHLEMPRRRRSDDDAKALVEPKDAYNFWANWRAIPAPNKLAALVLAAALAVVGTVNSWIGYHDEMVPESQTYLYSHRDSKGKAASPMAKSAGLTAAIAGGLLYALRRQLRSYMTFKAHAAPKIDRTTQVQVRELFRGRSRVPLQNVVLRIVACNMEMGQRRRGSGKRRRTEAVCEPVRGVVLFEKRVAEIPAGAAVEEAFPETFCFGPIFDALFPPCKISETHGVELHWEIQLLIDELVDQEIVGSLSRLNERDFFETAPQDRLSAALPAGF